MLTKGATSRFPVISRGVDLPSLASPWGLSVRFLILLDPRTMAELLSLEPISPSKADLKGSRIPGSTARLDLLILSSVRKYS